MTLFTRKALSAALIAATALSALPAEAGDRYDRPIRVERHTDAGELVAAGILGLAAGAIIAGIAQPAYREPAYRHPHAFPRPSPDRHYFAPVYHAPPVVTYDSAPFEPWSNDWYRYCRDRYRTFDDVTGTFMGYDGRRHFCVAAAG